MPSRPPKKLEAIVSFFIPHACREEVLGDLWERYTGPAQYVFLAICVVSFVIVSRIRRTADAEILMMEALLIYASYIAAAWYTDRGLLMDGWVFLRLVLPAVLAVAFMAIEDAWSPVRERSVLRLTGEVAAGMLFAFLWMFSMLPHTLNLVGASASLVPVSTFRILFRPQIDKPQPATGPAAWDEPAVAPRNKKNIYVFAAVFLLIAIILTSRPRIAPLFVTVLIVFWLGFSRARKE